MTNADAAAPGQPKKERSPSFPYIGLPRALERARQVYAHARRHDARVSDVAAAWSMAPKSSSTLQTVAALLAFGLLEDQGSGESRKVRISDLAFKALEDQRPGAREAALADAALKPKLIAEYAERWKDGRPADGICISELRIDRGFTDDGAKQFLRVFDDTVGFTNSPGSDKQDDKPEATESGRLNLRDCPPNSGRVIEETPHKGPPPPARTGVAIMESERVVFTEETNPQNYLKLIASGEVDESLLEALEDYVKRQKKRLGIGPGQVPGEATH